MKSVYQQPHWLSRIYERTCAGENGECRLWQGSLNAGGYGTIKYQGKSALVHRVVMSITTGTPLKHPMQVIHSCNNPRCVAVSHLSYGTHSDNMADKIRHGRGGLRNLTDEQAGVIRASREPGVVLASRFNVTTTCISAIRSGRMYKIQATLVPRFIGGLGI